MVQIGRSNANMISSMSKQGFVRVWISILTLKIISGYLKSQIKIFYVRNEILTNKPIFRHT